MNIEEILKQFEDVILDDMESACGMNIQESKEGKNFVKEAQKTMEQLGRLKGLVYDFKGEDGKLTMEQTAVINNIQKAIDDIKKINPDANKWIH